MNAKLLLMLAATFGTGYAIGRVRSNQIAARRGGRRNTAQKVAQGLLTVHGVVESDPQFFQAVADRGLRVTDTGRLLRVMR